MARTDIRDDAHWHDLRKPCVNASDVASLIPGSDPYKSKGQLWHEMKGTYARQDLSDDERVRIGKYVQDGIMAASADKYACTFVKARAHYTDDAINGLMGATPDSFLDHEDSDTVVEFKNISHGSWKDNSRKHDDGFEEWPLRHQIQVQAQMACTGATNAILIALIAGDRIVRADIPRHEGAIARLRQEVVKFHASLAANEEPPLEMPGDYDLARFVWPGGEGKVDLRGDPRIEEWLANMRQLRETAKAVESDIKKIQGEVLAYCTENKFSSISANAGKISCVWREAKPAREVHFSAQAAHNELRITVS